MIINDKKAELILTSETLKRSDVKFLISYCKNLLETRANIKWKICQICDRVCDTIENNKVKRSDYSQAQFARDIGVKEKTLWRWKKEYDILYSKVQEKELKDLKRRQIEDILGKANRQTSKEDVRKLIKEKSKESKEDVSLKEYSYRLGNIKFFICDTAALDLLDQKTLKEVYVSVGKIKDKLDKHFCGVEQVDYRAMKRKSALEQVRELEQ
jgi:ribosomal protein S24E